MSWSVIPFLWAVPLHRCYFLQIWAVNILEERKANCIKGAILLKMQPGQGTSGQKMVLNSFHMWINEHRLVRNIVLRCRRHNGMENIPVGLEGALGWKLGTARSGRDTLLYNKRETNALLWSWVPLPGFSCSAELVVAEIGVGAALPQVLAGGIVILEADDGPQTTVVSIHCRWGFLGGNYKKKTKPKKQFFISPARSAG